MAAEQLLDTVWRVGGAGLTHDLDCHCYLIRDDDGGGILVDTGTGLAAGAWLAAVAEVCDPHRLTGVVVTHYHADHAGGAAAAHASGLTVFGSPETAAALETADEVRTSLGVARTAGVYPSDYRLSPRRFGPSAAGSSPAAWMSRSLPRRATATGTWSCWPARPAGPCCSAATACSRAVG